MISKTVNRVSEQTSDSINERIDLETRRRVRGLAGHPNAIHRRLDELDREWDIERILEANAASFSLLGLTLGTTVDRRWLALPVGVAAFLLQHAVQGWCPPVPVFRRFGVRTAAEIDRERYALKFLRGDFDDASRADGSADQRARRTLAAVRA